MKRTMPVRLLTRYIRDAQFRSLAGIYIGLAVDILYAAFRAIVGLRYDSRWFLSMAVYYAVLGMLRAYCQESHSLQIVQSHGLHIEPNPAWGHCPGDSTF